MAGFEKKKGTGQTLEHMNADFIDTSYQKWISRQMDARVLEYSDTSKITICCGTWNVNARALPEPYDLSSWLSLRGSPFADIYVISLQEMVDLNMINVVLVTSTSDEMSMFWSQKILDTLNNMTGGDNYRMVTERHLVGLMGMVFAKKTLVPHITDVRSTVVYTGGYGTTGNKGGVAIRMDVRDSGLCFISAHFHANRGNIEQRNQDFQTIYENAIFTPSGGDRNSGKRQSKVSTSATNATISHPALPSGIRPNSLNFANTKAHLALDVACHEQIFWLGDLNYRVGGDLDDVGVLDMVEHNEWPSLLEHDQLNRERELGNVFTGFEEGKIIFPPTYKFQPGTEIYEKRPDKKLRAPAWCDRILWKSNLIIKDSSTLLAYQSINKLSISDHRPVHAWFETTIRQIVPERMRHLYQDLLFNVDKWINASTPKLEVSSRVFDLGDITMETRHRVTIDIHNNGTVMTEWAFVPKNDDTIVSPPWLKFKPSDGILAPGERMTITATIFLSIELMGNLFPNYTSGPLRLDEIVVLRVKKGSDIFCIFTSAIPEANILDTKAKAAQMALSIQHRSVHYEKSPIPSASVENAHTPPLVVSNNNPIRSRATSDSNNSGNDNSKSTSQQETSRRSPVPSMPRAKTTAIAAAMTSIANSGTFNNNNNSGKSTVIEKDEDESDDEPDIDMGDIYGRKSTI